MRDVSLLLFCCLFIVSSMPAPAGTGSTRPLILDSQKYAPGTFPYRKAGFPQNDWLSFAYDIREPIPCDLVRTSVFIVTEEGETDGDPQPYILTHVDATSGVPNRVQSGFYMHGVDVTEGPFDCGYIENKKGFGGVSAVSTDDLSLTEGLKLVGTFRLSGKSVDIVARRISGATQILIRYRDQSQVLLESKPLQVHFELTVDLVCDIDRDGKPDAIVSFSRSRLISPATQLKLYLSSKAAPGKLVGEAASYWTPNR